MKKKLYLAIAIGGLFFGGCTPPTEIKVTQQRKTSSPLTNILTVYVDEACNFSLADSTGYNLCLKAHFDDTTSVKKRGRVEEMLAGNLSTPGTAVYGSCDLLGMKNADMTVDNSYAVFRKLVDSLHVDGILVVQLQSLEREYYKGSGGGMIPGGRYGAPEMTPGSGPGVAETGYFACYLLDPKDLLHSVWTAKFDTKYAGNGRELSRKMTKLLAKALINEGYTVH